MDGLLPEPEGPDAARVERSADPVLVGYLAGRDAPCPRCGYNLRGVESSRCPECGGALELTLVGSSRVDLQACKLEYSIVSPK